MGGQKLEGAGTASVEPAVDVAAGGEDSVIGRAAFLNTPRSPQVYLEPLCPLLVLPQR